MVLPVNGAGAAGSGGGLTAAGAVALPCCGRRREVSFLRRGGRFGRGATRGDGGPGIWTDGRRRATPRG